MNSASVDRTSSIPRTEVGLWVAAVAASELLLPGAGVVLAGVLAFTRLRPCPLLVRFGLVGLAVALLALQVSGTHAGGWMSGDVGPAVRAS